MFQQSFCMFQTLKKNMWTSGFFISKVIFLIKCSPNCFNFFLNFNIFHKKGSMCSRHSKNKNIYTFLDFDIWISWNTIIILNLWSWFKINYRFDYNVSFNAKIIEFLSCYMSYLDSNLICSIWKTMWKMHCKPIKNCHLENAVFGKDFNLGAIGSFFLLSSKSDPKNW